MWCRPGFAERWEVILLQCPDAADGAGSGVARGMYRCLIKDVEVMLAEVGVVEVAVVARVVEEWAGLWPPVLPVNVFARNAATGHRISLVYRVSKGNARNAEQL